MSDDYKKDMIMVYHIPVDGYTRQQSEVILKDFMDGFTTNDFYREYFFPKTNSGGKIDIEILNLKNQKTQNISIKLEELEDIMMKHYDKPKWERKMKLKNILK